MAKGTEYTIDKKEEISKLGKGSAVETWIRIWATTKGGTYFHLDIADAELGKADERLTARARQLDAI